MASRNGFVENPLTIPVELKRIVEKYQKRMKITTYNQAIRTLLETHPEVVYEVLRVYADVITSEREDVPG